MPEPVEPQVNLMTEQDFKGINDALRNADNPDERAKVEGYAADAYPALYAAYRQERDRAERAEELAGNYMDALAYHEGCADTMGDFMALRSRADKLAEAVERLAFIKITIAAGEFDQCVACGWDVTDDHPHHDRDCFVAQALRAYRAGGGEGK